MLLYEIKPGSNVILEVVMGNKRFDVPIRVEKIDGLSILTNTFRYGGRIVDFSNRSFGHLLFNIYASDSRNQGRFVWKGVNLEVVSYKGVEFYRITSKVPVQQGAVSNRRGENRMLLDIPGEAMEDATGRMAMVRIHDISNQGVSFYGPRGFIENNDIVHLRFTEQVTDHIFDIHVEVQCVRVVDAEPGSQLYGCKVRLQNREMATFICLRQLMAKRRDKDSSFLF